MHTVGLADDVAAAETRPDEFEALRQAALKASPGDLDTVPNPPTEYGGRDEGGECECPFCGDGYVDVVTYSNFDHVAMGVQFFGIGDEFGNYEAYFRQARPATILALLAERDALRAQVEELNLLVAEAKGQLEDLDLRNNRYRDLCREMARAAGLVVDELLHGTIEQYHKIGPEFTRKDGAEFFHISTVLDREELLRSLGAALSHAKELGVEP